MGVASIIVPTVLGEGLILVSLWKPFVLLLPIVAWAWMVSTIFDKHCARFFLPRNGWNLVHLTIGLVAFLVALALPVEGEAGVWASFGVIVVLLAGDVLAFMSITNKDERVPADHHLKLDLSSWKKAREAKAAAKKQGKVELVIKAPDKSVLAVPNIDAPEFATRTASEAALISGLEARTTQVEIAPSGKDPSYVLANLIDGQRVIGRSMPPAEAQAIIDFWKGAAKLDVADRRRRQTADINIERGASRHKVRIATLGSQAGQRLTMLVDPEQQVRRKDEEMGLLEAQAAEIKTLISVNEGVVVLGALPDGGRTTLLYSLVKMHDAYTQNVQTVEVELQDTLEGVRQNKFDPQSEGPEFSTLLRSIIRRDPNVVGVAEVPDTNTAKEMVRADHERCRQYASIVAGSAIEALVKWVKLVGDQELAAKNIKGVIAERLVRRVCSNCRVPYQPPPEMLKKLGLPADKVKQLMKRGGQVLIKNKPETCPVCNGSGYFGQEGCFEVFPFDDGCRELLKAGNIAGLRAEFRKKQYPTIQQAALSKAVAGVTTVDEVLRISAEVAPPPPPGGNPGGGPGAKPPAPGAAPVKA
jgi:general secretion pathway protein E